MKKVLKFIILNIYFYRSITTTNHTSSNILPFFDDTATQSCYIVGVDDQDPQSSTNLYILCLKYDIEIFHKKDKSNSFWSNIKYKIDFAEIKPNRNDLSLEDIEECNEFIFNTFSFNNEKLSIPEIKEAIRKKDLTFSIFRGSEFSKNKQKSKTFGSIDNIKENGITEKIFSHLNYTVNLNFTFDDNVTENAEGEHFFETTPRVNFVGKMEDIGVIDNYLDNELRDEMIKSFENYSSSNSAQGEEGEIFGFKVNFVESD